VSDRAVELFERFVEQLASGGRANVAEVVIEAGDQGEVLAAMIASYLATRPTAQPDAAEVAAFASRPELDPPRPWQELLPALRKQARLNRTELVRRLAALLGVQGSESQVGGYLHELETGLLEPARVRRPVVEALASIFAVPATLLETSRRLPGLPPPNRAIVFSRAAGVDASASLAMLDDEPPTDPRVDDLFTGGGGG
jgi:hypothetical protein